VDLIFDCSRPIHGTLSVVDSDHLDLTQFILGPVEHRTSYKLNISRQNCPPTPLPEISLSSTSFRRLDTNLFSPIVKDMEYKIG
jgi:hypothetical protein